MDPLTKAFLKRVAKTLLIGFLWLALTTTFAIKDDNAFVEKRITAGNVFFYSWFIISLSLLVIIYKKMWAQRQRTE